MARLPDFVIAGSQRGGSSFLASVLREHPGVFMPQAEIPYFQDPDFQETPRAEFEALFHDARPDQVVGIKRPNYLAFPFVAERIKALMPEAKIIAILRNPIERAISAYFLNVMHGFVPAVPIERGLRAILDGRWTKAYPRSSEIIEFGYYGRQLRHYLTLFEADKFLVLAQERVHAEPAEKTIRRLYEFVGVDPNYEARTRGRSTTIYSLPRLRLQRIANRFKYTYSTPRTRLYWNDPSRLGRVVLRQIERVDFKLFHGDPGAKPELSEPLRAELRELYRADVGELRSLGLVEELPWADFAPSAVHQVGV